MKLLKEIIDTGIESFITEELTESGEKAKSYYIEGIFMQGNRKNFNGRIYLPEVLSKEVGRFTEDNIKRNRGFGELGHPDSPNINFERVSHLIKELRQEGDDFYGKAKIIDTPMGKIVKTLIDEKAQLGVSSRGTGSLRQAGAGIMEVGSDYRLATVDIVNNPSAPDAFVRNVMEGVDFFFEGETKSWFPVYMEQLRGKISKMSSRQLSEHKIKLFENYINILAKVI